MPAGKEAEDISPNLLFPHQKNLDFWKCVTCTGKVTLKIEALLIMGKELKLCVQCQIYDILFLPIRKNTFSSSHFSRSPPSFQMERNTNGYAEKEEGK